MALGEEVLQVADFVLVVSLLLDPLKFGEHLWGFAGLGATLFNSFSLGARYVNDFLRLRGRHIVQIEALVGLRLDSHFGIFVD